MRARARAGTIGRPQYIYIVVRGGIPEPDGVDASIVGVVTNPREALRMLKASIMDLRRDAGPEVSSATPNISRWKLERVQELCPRSDILKVRPGEVVNIRLNRREVT